MVDIKFYKQRKKELGITFEELAKRSNLPQSTIYDIFRGVTKNPRIDTLAAIERALGIGDAPPQERETVETKKAPSGGAGLYALTADEAILIDYYRRLVPANKITVFNLLKSVFETARDIPIETVREYIGVLN